MAKLNGSIMMDSWSLWRVNLSLSQAYLSRMAVAGWARAREEKDPHKRRPWRGAFSSGKGVRGPHGIWSQMGPGKQWYS